MMIGRLIQTALISISSGACLSQAPTFNNDRTKEPNNAIITETETININDAWIRQRATKTTNEWAYNETNTAQPQKTYYQDSGNGINIDMDRYDYNYIDPNGYGTLKITSYRYMIKTLNFYDDFAYYENGVVGWQCIYLTLDIIEIDANYSWENINPNTESNLHIMQQNGAVSIAPQRAVIFNDQQRPRTNYATPREIMEDYLEKVEIPSQAEIDTYVEIYDYDQDTDSTYEGSYINGATSINNYIAGYLNGDETDLTMYLQDSYIPRSENNNKNYCSLAVCTYYEVFGSISYNPNRKYMTQIDNVHFNLDMDIEWTKAINTNPTTNEPVDIPGIMFDVIAMPFTFYSQAFNLTLFPGTQYAVRITDVVLVFLTGLIIIFLVRKIASLRG